MKKQSLYILLFFLSCLTASCSRIDELFGVDGGMSKTCKMVLHCSNPSYDQSSTRATGNSWEDEDEIYIYFTDGIYGVGKYDSSSDAWTFSYEGDLNLISNGNCVSYYTRGGSRSGTIVSLNEQTPVYADQNAAYSFSNDCLTLSAEINPYSTRLRFKGDAGKSLVLKSGLKFYSSIDFSVNEFSSSEKEISFVVNGEGYTHYIYCAPIEEDVSIALSSGLNNFARVLVPSLFSKGISSVFSIPSRDALSGWELLNKNETIGGHEYVDLGLPSGLLWATCNLGASSPEESGDYYAWGELSPKKDFSWENYKYCQGSSNSITKYNLNYDNGPDVDWILELQEEDDALFNSWGGNWRMPSAVEWDELGRYCDISIVEVDGKNIARVQGPNGNVLYLPLAGAMVESTLMWNETSCYWSSSISGGTQSKYAIYNGDRIITSFIEKHKGLLIRGVYSEKPKPCAITSYEYEIIDETTVLIHGRIENFSTTPYEITGGLFIGEDLGYGSRQIFFDDYDSDGNFSVLVTDLTPGQQYEYCSFIWLNSCCATSGEIYSLYMPDVQQEPDPEPYTFNVEISDVSVLGTTSASIEIYVQCNYPLANFSGTIIYYESGQEYDQQSISCDLNYFDDDYSCHMSCQLSDLKSGTSYVVYPEVFHYESGQTFTGSWSTFETEEEIIPDTPEPVEDTHEYVDLGLPSGTLWATCNIGATNPEDAGMYFAWGETSGKSSFDWSNYQHCNGTSSSMTKYCTSSSYGIVDNKTVLDSTDDAATVNWGENWRMPTKAEFEELNSKCTRTWVTINNMSGFTFKGPNGKSIFIPAAGKNNKLENSIWSPAGCYWTSTLGTNNTPYNVDFDRPGFYIDCNTSGYKYLGQSVRPVRAK